MSTTDDIYYSKKNYKKDGKSFGQKAKMSAEKRKMKCNPDANNPNRNPPKKEVVDNENDFFERKDKKSSKHWNDKFIQQEIQAEEDAMRDAITSFEEQEEEEEEGPPPLDPDELERINDFCFQAAMELRSRNDQELRDFVLKKQLEEMFQNVSFFENEQEHTCEEVINSRKTELVKELKAENRLKRATINNLVQQIEANEGLINRLLEDPDQDHNYFVDLNIEDLVPPLTVEDLD